MEDRLSRRKMGDQRKGREEERDERIRRRIDETEITRAKGVAKGKSNNKRTEKAQER